MNPQMTLKLIGIFLVLIAAVMLSLVVFDAITFDEVRDNLAKLFAVAAIMAGATFLITLIQGPHDKK